MHAPQLPLGSSPAGLSAGSYSFTVSDQRGSSLTLSITVPDNPSLSASVSPASDSVSTDGSIAVSVADGTPPFDAKWSSGHTGLVISDLPQGIYTLSLTDANGCSLSATYVLGVVTGTHDATLPRPQVLPNPATDYLELRYYAPGPTVLSLHNALGQQVLRTVLGASRQGVDISALAPGCYVVRLEQEGEGPLAQSLIIRR